MCKKLHLPLVLVGFIVSRAMVLAMAPYASDVPVYFAAARQWNVARAPYRDVPFEYPPLAALVCYAPVAAGAATEVTYRRWFVAEMLGFDVVALLFLLRERARRGLAPVWWYVLLTTLMQPLLYDRFDVAVGCLLLVAVAAESQLALFCGALLKFVPALASPLLLLWPGSPARQRWRALCVALLLPLAVTLCGAWLWLGRSLTTPITYHASRGIQVESTWASVALLAHLAGNPLSVLTSHRAQHLAGGLAERLLPWTGPINLLASGAAIVLVVTAWRRRACRDRGDLAAGCLIVLLAFLATCRVLSPQFLLWLVPIAPLCLVRAEERRARRTFLALTVACVALSSYLFRRLLWALVALHPAVIGLYALRNALLVLMLLVLARCTARSAFLPPRRAARTSR